MPAQPTYRALVVASLAATTLANAEFLATDPRLSALPLWLAIVYLAGGAAYVVAIPMCLRSMREGFALAAALGVLGGLVALADNLGVSGSTPNPATYAVNAAVMALHIPLVVAGLGWLRRAGGSTSRNAPLHGRKTD